MIKLEKKEAVVTIKVLDQDVQVKQNISTELKYGIALTSAQGAIRNGIISRDLFESALFAQMVLHYSNFEYQNMGAANISDVYDILEENGIITEIKNAIPEKEYKVFINSANDVFESVKESMNSSTRAIEAVLTTLFEGLESLGILLGNSKEETEIEIVE